MTFVIEGKPIIQQRPRRGQYGQFYDPSANEKKALGFYLLAERQRAKASILAGDLWVRIAFYGMEKGDLDNAIKAIWDAGNGILWNDDEQIVKLIASKERKSSQPRTEITIESLEGKHNV